MNKRDTEPCAGFEWQDGNAIGRGRGLLVPAWVRRERQQGDNTPAKAVPETAAASVPETVAVPNKPPPGVNDLASLPLTDDDVALERARALTERLLINHVSGLDALSARFCLDLFAAATLRVLHSPDYASSSWADVLSYLQDPLWDSTRQIMVDIQNDNTPPRHTDAGGWIFENMRAALKLPESSLERLFRRGVTVIRDAIDALGDKSKSHRVKKPAGIPVFKPGPMAKAFACIDNIDDKQRDRAERDLEAAHANRGYRLVPNVRKASRNLARVAGDFENLAEPIRHLQTELALAGAMDPTDFRVSPMLLLGDPGIGKTHLALQLANALGVPMEKISAGGAQGAFQLTGSHPTWNRAMPGSVFELLSMGTSAAPVMVIDEVDKIGQASQYPLEPALLDIMEPGTARTFKDEFYNLEFDASHIVFVATANDIHAVPAHLQSRMAVFSVPRPQPAQRLRIIQGEFARLRQKTRKNIKLYSTANDLAERVDMDLRQTLRLCQEAFALAMMSRSTTAKLTMPAAIRRSIGFIASATG